MLHPAYAEGGSPALFVVPRELQVKALALHGAFAGADPTPGVPPRAERPEDGQLIQGEPGVMARRAQGPMGHSRPTVLGKATR